MMGDGARIRMPYELKSVSPRASADILRITGVDTKGNATKIEARMVEHILKDHGEHGRSDHSMRDINDIARLQYVLDTYDAVEAAGQLKAYQTVKQNGMPGQAKTIAFSKAVNGTYFIVEAVPNTKAKCVYVVTAYMTKKAGAAQTANAAKTAARVTSETKNVQTPTKDNIPFSSDAVNAAERTEQGTVRNGEAAQSGETMKNKALHSGDERSIIRPGFVSGALTPDSRRASKHAEQYYEAVRHMKTDIQRIARNTGFSEKEIADIKSFVFEEEHDLGDSGIRRFHESYEMAQSWQRLIDVKEY